jgi:transcriptional regulator with XRE-family HTH domain
VVKCIIYEIVGERIRAIRKVKGLTQIQLAERSNLDDAYIGAVERGERNFSIDTLEKIVGGLEIHPAELFCFGGDAIDNIVRTSTGSYQRVYGGYQ